LAVCSDETASTVDGSAGLLAIRFINKQRRGLQYAGHMHAAATDFESNSPPYDFLPFPRHFSHLLFVYCSLFILEQLMQPRSHFLCDYTPSFSAMSHLFS
jgi:hypothetical protein